MRVYIAVAKLNLGNSAWVDVLNLIKQIIGRGNRPHQKLHWRGSPDTFELDDVAYSNTYIFAADFNLTDITFERFRKRLVSAFDVPDESVTFTQGTSTIKDNPTTFATYRHNAINRFRVGVLGCEIEGGCSYAMSHAEVLEYIKVNGWDDEGI